MKKTDPLGCFISSGVAFDGACGLASAVFFSKTSDTEVILWDNAGSASGDELLHVYLNNNTCVFTPSKAKAASKGIYVEIKSGAGGVVIDVEP